MTSDEATKRCSRCKEQFPLSSFYKNNSRKDGLGSQCRACTNLSSKEHYRRHKPDYLQRNKRTRRRQRTAILDIKSSSPCTDCGQKFHPFIMEFDHREPETKVFPIGRLGGRIGKQIRDEMKKCDLVCANCHKLRTFRRNQTRPEYSLATYE